VSIIWERSQRAGLVRIIFASLVQIALIYIRVFRFLAVLQLEHSCLF